MPFDIFSYNEIHYRIVFEIMQNIPAVILFKALLNDAGMVARQVKHTVLAALVKIFYKAVWLNTPGSQNIDVAHPSATDNVFT